MVEAAIFTQRQDALAATGEKVYAYVDAYEIVHLAVFQQWELESEKFTEVQIRHNYWPDRVGTFSIFAPEYELKYAFFIVPGAEVCECSDQLNGSEKVQTHFFSYFLHYVCPVLEGMGIKALSIHAQRNTCIAKILESLLYTSVHFKITNGDEVTIYDKYVIDLAKLQERLPHKNQGS